MQYTQYHHIYLEGQQGRERAERANERRKEGCLKGIEALNSILSLSLSLHISSTHFASLFLSLLIILMMLNQTGSLIKSSEFLHSNLFPHRCPYQRKPTRCSFSHSHHNSTSLTNPLKKDQPHLQSKTVKIQFNNSAKKMYSEQVIMRRKVLTTSEKFYNKKKTIVFNFVRDRNEREEEGDGRRFLKIGTRQISRMEVEHSQQFMEGEDGNSKAARKLKSVIFRQKGRKHTRLHTKTGDFFEESSSLLVLQRKKLTKTESFFSSLPQTLRKMTETNTEAFMKQQTQPTFEPKPTKQPDFDEFIPIKKIKTKKQPFVFGLCDKQSNNPHKNKEKLVAYQDFLWKVNYANGLYVIIPEAECSYKAFIGSGNNCTLIRSVLKRRFWWNITEKMENCQFVWTQLKVNSIFKDLQKSATGKVQPDPPLQQLQQEENSDLHQKIFNSTDCRNWSVHYQKHKKYESTINEKTYKHRVAFFKLKDIKKIQKSSQLILHNHLPQNCYIGNKKALFYYMRNYYQQRNQNVFDALPLSFHITKGTNDSNFKSFLKVYWQLQERKKKGEDIRNIWIVKPGENSNRGNGISVCHGLDDIKLRINGRQRNSDGSLRTFILQKYIQKPLLYKGRKFDIRHYLLITCINGTFKAYWYPQGYIRTSSSRFSLRRNTDLFTHLTNDAVQKYSQEYGKYEKGNKVSYQAFQEYLNKSKNQNKDGFFGQVLPKMKELALDAVKATYLCLDKQRKEHNFELLGMDFMIDEDMKPWLIEINTNPCLQLSCPLLSKLIPNLIEQTFKLVIDPLFPPPQQWQPNRKMYFPQHPLQQLSYQLLFDQSTHLQPKPHHSQLDRAMGKIDDQAQTFQNDGNFSEPQ